MKRNNFEKNTLYLTAGTILNKGIQFLAIPLFTTWLSTAEYGRYDLLYTYISLLIPIVTLSIGEALFRFLVEEKDDNKRKSIISSAFAFIGINYICAAFLIMIYFISYSEIAIGIAFVFYLLQELLNAYLKGYLRGLKKLELYSVSMVFSTLFMVICVFVLLYIMGQGVFGILLGYGLGVSLGNLMIILISRWNVFIEKKRISRNVISKMLRYSFPLVPNEISWWVMSASDRQIINWFFNYDANGIYAIAHKIPALCSVIFNMVSLSWQQEAVEYIDEPNREAHFNRIFNQVVDMAFSISICLLAGSFILYKYIFNIKYLEAAKYSPILIISATLIPVSQFFGGIQIALKKPKQNGITTVMGAVVNVVLHILLIKYIGLFAAAVSTVIANLLICCIRYVLIKHVYKVHVTHKTVILFVLFCYFVITAYGYNIQILCIINFVFAIFIFVCSNLSIIKGVRKYYE